MSPRSPLMCPINNSNWTWRDQDIRVSVRLHTSHAMRTVVINNRAADME
jgi:hypothetical protein